MAILVLCALPRASSCAMASPTSPQVTVREAEAFGKRVSDVCNARDLDSFRAMFDFDALFARAVDGLDLTPEHTRAVNNYARRDPDTPRTWMNISKPGPAGCRYLRARFEGELVWLLFRRATPISIQYSELAVKRRPSGELLIVDTRQMVQRGTSSQWLRALALRVKRAMGDALNADAGQEVELADALQNLSRLCATRQYSDALFYFDGCPDAVRRNIDVMHSRVVAARYADADVYERAVAEFRSLYSDDASIEFFDALFRVERREFTQGLRAIDRAERAIGGDPYLDAYRAGAFLGLRQPEQAKALAARAAEAEPDLSEAYWVLLVVSAIERDHNATAKALMAFERTAGKPFNGLNAPVFAEFVRSEPYRRLQRERAAAHATTRPTTLPSWKF